MNLHQSRRQDAGDLLEIIGFLLPSVKVVVVDLAKLFVFIHAIECTTSQLQSISTKSRLGSRSGQNYGEMI